MKPLLQALEDAGADEKSTPGTPAHTLALAADRVGDLLLALDWALRRIRTSLDTGDCYRHAERVHRLAIYGDHPGPQP